MRCLLEGTSTLCTLDIEVEDCVIGCVGNGEAEKEVETEVCRDVAA